MHGGAVALSGRWKSLSEMSWLVVCELEELVIEVLFDCGASLGGLLESQRVVADAPRSRA